MKNKIIFSVIFVFVFTTNFAFGQDTLKSKERNLIIKFSPFLFVGGDFITNSIGLPIGIEFKINKKLSFDQNFSYIMPCGDNGGYLMLTVDKIKGLRSDSEIKQYLNNRNNSTGFYLATHLLYQYTKATTNFHADNDEKVYRNLIALHEKIGWQSISKKGFVVDVAIGLGIRYAYSKSNYTKNYSDIFNEFTPTYWYHKPYEYGNKLFFSFNSSFKIGWVF